jgi:hypothetical protein
MNTKKDEIWQLHKEYFAVFGELPPVSPDDDFYDPKFIQRIKKAIGEGKPIR